MSLEHNIVFWDYSISTGEYLGWFRSPFVEMEPDHVFKVLSINKTTWTATVKVVASTFYTVGTILNNISVRGLKRVKFDE